MSARRGRSRHRAAARRTASAKPLAGRTSRAARPPPGAARAGTRRPAPRGPARRAGPRSAGLEQRPAEPSSASRTSPPRGRSRSCPSRRPRGPSASTLPVNPSVTIDVGDALGDREPLDVADEVQPVHAAQALVRLDDLLAALAGLRPVGEQRRRAGARRRATDQANAAPMKANWTRCSGRHDVVGADVEERDRRARDRHGDRQRRAVDALRALDVEQPGGERGAGRAAGDAARRRALGDRAGGLDDRRLGRRCGPRGRDRRPWRSRPARRRPRRRRPLGRARSAGAEEQDAGRRGGTRRRGGLARVGRRR